MLEALDYIVHSGEIVYAYEIEQKQNGMKCKYHHGIQAQPASSTKLNTNFFFPRFSQVLFNDSW
jgi:phosphodiesterase/alkaline phosphatase D-like protein